MNHPLTILTLVPLFGGIVVAGLGAERKKLVRGLSLFFSLIGLTGALCLWTHFNGASGDLQFVEQFDWVPSLGVQYYLGMDGLGLLMVMLTAIVTPLAILVSWSMNDRAHIYHALDSVAAGGLVRHVHRAEFFPLVHVLGTGPDPRVFPGQTLGRSEPRPGGDAVFHLHHGRQRGLAVEFPGHLARHQNGDGAGLL